MSIDPEQRAQIKRNLEFVQENIDKAARRAGRSPAEVKLLVVTKTHPLDIVECVIAAGAIDLGENYVEEARDKIIALNQYSRCAWHMIGHVQSRKSNQVVEYFDYLHSLDSVKLAQRLNTHALEISRILPVFLEFNLSGEEGKSGWRVGAESKWEVLLPEIETVINLPNLRVCGLMTMPPYFENPEDARPYFQRLYRLRDLFKREFKHIDWQELSMGMSGDYEVAIEEGASWVRIGQAILGARQP
jgi:pyridoxal phosphate enzyme (YggS family)